MDIECENEEVKLMPLSKCPFQINLPVAAMQVNIVITRIR